MCKVYRHKTFFQVFSHPDRAKLTSWLNEKGIPYEATASCVSVDITPVSESAFLRSAEAGFCEYEDMRETMKKVRRNLAARNLLRDEPLRSSRSYEDEPYHF